MPKKKNPNLPEEILIEIFLRLPAKAVGRCRLLSKTWRIKLSNSQFVKLHLLNHRPTSPGNLLLISPVDDSVHTIDGPIAETTLDFGITWGRVLGSCNGLALLLNLDKEPFLVNPTTLQHFKLPPLSLGFKDILFSEYGLGYDSSSDDYKVLLLTYFPVGANRCDRFYHVYSVKSGSWKRVASSPNCNTRMLGGAFVNGALHGYSICKQTNSTVAYVIDTFDLVDDVFREIPAPPISYPIYGNPIHAGDTRLLVLEGCLCMTLAYNSGDIELWMMKHYGLADSWTKFTIPANREKSRRLPLCSLGDRKIVFLTGNKLVVYDFRDGTTKNMVVDGDPTAYRYAVAYVDSLVSPNHQYSN